MRIILVGTAFPYRGGLAAFNERLAIEFQKEGEDISIETFTLQYPNFLFPGKTQYSNGTAPDLKINRSVHSVNPLNWRKTAKAIAKQNPDVVIFAYWMSFMAPCFGTIARVLKRRCNARCIGLIHNMIAHEPSIFDKIFAPYFVNAMDGFFTLSQSVFKEIELFERKPKPKSWSPHPIYDTYGALISKEQACRHLGLQPDKRYILFFGFIREYKGLDLLLHAMANERIKNSNIHLLVAGEFYSNEEKYKKLTEHLDLQNITWFSEYIPDNEVNNYFCAADVIVQPYKSATQSGVTQVGYHFEKPMIVTNVGGLAEIIPDEKVGYVVEPNSHALANAIVKFFASDNAVKMTENIRDEKKKYAWNILTKKMTSLMNNI